MGTYGVRGCSRCPLGQYRLVLNHGRKDFAYRPCRVCDVRCAYFETPAFSAMRTRSATVRTPSFFHDRAAVELDGLLDRAEIVGDLLVEPSGHHVVITSRSRGVRLAILAWSAAISV
jgi:hypothetical protein